MNTTITLTTEQINALKGTVPTLSTLQNKILAIKTIREVTSLSLHESKILMDIMQLIEEKKTTRAAVGLSWAQPIEAPVPYSTASLGAAFAAVQSVLHSLQPADFTSDRKHVDF